MNNSSLTGKVIVVTGGTGVLGDAFNKALAASGASVVIMGRNTQKANERAAEIVASGGDALAVPADVTRLAELEEAREIILRKYKKIDGLVNAAGGNIADAVVAPGADVFDLNLDAMKEVMNLNLFGTLLPTQVFGKCIVETTGRGSIVNVSSVSAWKGVSRVLGYSMAKSAIESYTKWFAVELGNRYGDAVRMNAIVPGFFITEQNRALLTNADGSYTQRGNAVIAQTPFRRFGLPEELTGALTWLLSDASAFVNGTSVVIDGGFLSFSGV